MTIDQWKRAGEITTQLRELYTLRERLIAIEKLGEEGAKMLIRLKAETGSHIDIFEIDSYPKWERQPEWIKMIHKAFVVTLREAYDKEIKKLEQEFEAL